MVLPVDSGVPTLATTEGESGGSAPLVVAVAPGDVVGRYRVLERIGSGGMGVVFVAHDPELDRKVALKVVPTHGARADELQRRVGREAKALAQLSHPNVVAVFDVGACTGGVFIAMEWVDGVSARVWQVRAQPSWRDIVRVYVDAGRGLAAAHAAGVVHRDFKPDNVLVDREGRARVVDFGLAQAAGSTPSREEVRAGTPAYMAAERHGQARVDEREDQFSFCVALYEQLFGVRPFTGDTAAEIAIQILTGSVRPSHGDTGVPAWIESVIMRGLHRDAALRHASMTALLMALECERPRRRRRGWTVGIAVVAGAGALAFALRDATTPCQGARAAMAPTWDPARRAALDRSLAAAPTWTPDRRARLMARVDEYAEEWIAAKDHACVATYIEATQAADELDQRMACLDQRLRGRAALR